MSTAPDPTTHPMTQITPAAVPWEKCKKGLLIFSALIVLGGLSVGGYYAGNSTTISTFFQTYSVSIITYSVTLSGGLILGGLCMLAYKGAKWSSVDKALLLAGLALTGYGLYSVLTTNLPHLGEYYTISYLEGGLTALSCVGAAAIVGFIFYWIGSKIKRVNETLNVLNAHLAMQADQMRRHGPKAMET